MKPDFENARLTPFKIWIILLPIIVPKALVQMATGAGKTFTAITAAYRLLKYGKMNRILLLVDTKVLENKQSVNFLLIHQMMTPALFSQLYGVRRLKSSYIPLLMFRFASATIQKNMYSILKGEEIG
ncbi:MAG: DEAD/DEAH box helicase family protein [Enterocloster sp.]